MQELPKLIGDYLDGCENGKKLSPDTLKAYRIDLRQFREFAGERWAEKETLNRYVAHLNRRFAPRSVKRKLASVRAFFSELSFNEALETNPFDKLHMKIQYPQQLPRTIPEETVRRLLQSAYDGYDPARRETLLDIVVLELLFSTGLRVSELCALTPETVSLSDGGLRLLVRGKGRKERVIEITTPELIELMKTYVSRYAAEISAQNPWPRSPSGASYITAFRTSGPQATSRPICSATPSPRLCWRPGWTYGISSRSWATAPYRPPRSTPTLPRPVRRSSWRRSTQEGR